MVGSAPGIEVCAREANDGGLVNRLVKANDDKFDGHTPGRAVTPAPTCRHAADVRASAGCIGLSSVCAFGSRGPGAPFGSREPMTEVDREPVG